MSRHDGKNLLHYARHPVTGALLWPIAWENGVSKVSFYERFRKLGVRDGDLSALDRLTAAQADAVVSVLAPVDKWERLAVRNGRSVASYRWRLDRRPGEHEWAASAPRVPVRVRSPLPVFRSYSSARVCERVRVSAEQFEAVKSRVQSPDGEYYRMVLFQEAQMNGISARVLSSRLAKGWHPVDACSYRVARLELLRR